MAIKSGRVKKRARSKSGQSSATGAAAGREPRKRASEYLAERAHRELRALIMTGQYSPGDHLKEEELVKVLHVSRSIVRQALVQLTSEGLLIDQPKRGKTVTVFEEEKIAQLLPIRIALEQLAVREAIVHLTDQDAAALTQMSARLRDPKISLADQDAADIALHRKIWSTAGNPELELLLNRVVGPFQLMASAVMVSPLYRRNSLGISWQNILLERERDAGGHQLLVEAICRRDAEAGTAAMADHLAVNYATSPEEFGRKVGELMQRYWHNNSDRRESSRDFGLPSQK
jgi:DNA-binding GntR family transcriptional regulator